MRKGTWDRQLQGHHGRDRAKARKGGRKGRPRLVELEGLESRTLLATIPAATPTAGPLNLSNLTGNVGGNTAAAESSTQVAVDPNDPSKLVAVWVDNDPTMSPRRTTRSRSSWRRPTRSTRARAGCRCRSSRPRRSARHPGTTVSPILIDPTTSNPPKPYIDETSPSLGFDDSGNFYILSEYYSHELRRRQRRSALQKYSFNGSFPTSVGFSSNQQSPDPYPLRRGRPEGPLPVGSAPPTTRRSTPRWRWTTTRRPSRPA